MRRWRRWCRRTRRAQQFDWEARFRDSRGPGSQVEITGEKLRELVHGVVYSLAEAAAEGTTRHDAWLDYTIAVYNRVSGTDLESQTKELDRAVDQAWNDLVPELDATLRMSVRTASRLARALSEVLA